MESRVHFFTGPAFGSDFVILEGFILSFPQKRDLLRIGDENFHPSFTLTGKMT